MTKILTQANNAHVNIRIKIFYGLLVLTSMAVLFYAFNLYRVIRNTVSVSKIEEKLTQSQSEVAKLDSKYLELLSKVSPDKMQNYGLSVAKNSEYIQTGKTLGTAFSPLHEF